MWGKEIYKIYVFILRLVAVNVGVNDGKSVREDNPCLPAYFYKAFDWDVLFL